MPIALLSIIALTVCLFNQIIITKCPSFTVIAITARVLLLLKYLFRLFSRFRQIQARLIGLRLLYSSYKSSSSGQELFLPLPIDTAFLNFGLTRSGFSFYIKDFVVSNRSILVLKVALLAYYLTSLAFANTYSLISYIVLIRMSLVTNSLLSRSSSRSQYIQKLTFSASIRRTISIPFNQVSILSNSLGMLLPFFKDYIEYFTIVSQNLSFFNKLNVAPNYIQVDPVYMLVVLQLLKGVLKVAVSRAYLSA